MNDDNFVLEKKLLSVNPICGIFDFFAILIILSICFFVFLFFCELHYLNKNALPGILIGSFIGLTVTLSKQRQIVGVFKQSNKNKLLKRISDLGYVKLSGDSKIIYIKSVHRLQRWDSDLIHIHTNENEFIQIIAPHYIMKNL